jgi:AAA ATPase domain
VATAGPAPATGRHPQLGHLDVRPRGKAPRPPGPTMPSAWRHNAAACCRSWTASSSISRPSCQPSPPTSRARSRTACWAAPGGSCHPRPPIHRRPSATGDPTGDHPDRHRYPALSWVFRSRSRGLQIAPPCSAAAARHTRADMADQVTAGWFVGRTQELARLRQLLGCAVGGEPLVALVGGEAGVGKTRLVQQLAAAAQEQGVRVLGGGCVPFPTSSPSWGCRAGWRPPRSPTAWAWTDGGQCHAVVAALAGVAEFAGHWDGDGHVAPGAASGIEQAAGQGLGVIVKVPQGSGVAPRSLCADRPAAGMTHNRTKP